MKTIGIVAEYNPFHTGHAWHIQETRRLFYEETAVVAVMSGNWVQRGECAVTVPSGGHWCGGCPLLRQRVR